MLTLSDLKTADLSANLTQHDTYAVKEYKWNSIFRIIHVRIK